MVSDPWFEPTAATWSPGTTGRFGATLTNVGEMEVHLAGIVLTSDSPWVKVDPTGWYWFVISPGMAYTDAEFTVSLSADSVPGTGITLTAMADVERCEPGDEYSSCPEPAPITLTVVVE